MAMERHTPSQDRDRDVAALLEEPTILVVDDDENTRRTLTRILERQGYQVETAGTVEEALRKSEQRPFNVGLIDLRLPDGEGVDLLKRLKSRHPDVDVIVSTGHASAETAVRALNQGAVAYVTKPLNLDEVLSQVDEILDKQRLVEAKRAAERRLRNSEKRYRSLFEDIPVGLYRSTADGRILHANQALVDMLGYPDRQTLLKTDVRDLYVDPQDRQRETALLDQDGIVRGFEMRLRRLDGSVIWVRDTMQVDRDVRGRPVTYQGSLEDITERKRAEQALRESEERYRTLFERLPVGVFRSTPDGRFLDANPTHVELLGCPDLETLLATPVTEFYPQPEDRQHWKDLTAEAGITEAVEAEWRRLDGTSVWVQEYARAVRDADGEVMYYDGIAVDVTARKRAQEALQRQLGRASLLNQITSAMTARQDLDSTLRVVVQRLEESFTDLASIWLRQGDSDVFTLASAGDRSRDVVRRASLPRQMALPSETARRLMRGEMRYLADLKQLEVPVVKRLVERTGARSAVIAPLAAEDVLLGVVVSARREPNAFSRQERDFLHSLALHVGLAVRQARLYENLGEAYQDLRQTQQAMMRQQRLRALGEMASGIAHDINNAISPIPLYTAIIRREAGLSDRARDHLRTIETAVSAVEETVGRMRQFYRTREDQNMQPVDVSQAARQAIGLTRPRWRDVPQEQGITIDLHTDLPDDLPPVLGIEGEIRQAVTNLILNAVDAMPGGGVLSLTTRVGTGDPPHVVLEVSDTGIGMDEETQQRCFEPFFSTKGERGSGMGLATVYGTMQRHGGDVQLDSAPGEGTSVRLLFPVRDLVEAEVVDEAVERLPPLRVLCVDDEPTVRQALRGALEGEGHTVALAAGGEAGLETFRAAELRGEPFDVVITDLGMPDVSGRDVARSVKREAPETPVILLTGWGRRLKAEDDVPAAVDLMLGKPPTIEGLNRALAQVMAKTP
jgi:PAS domain S-box-containing protein